ncbi:MAG: hypothetical protein WC776_05390 [Patescibacteria group bacterium]|jgi:hypothetical protein
MRFHLLALLLPAALAIGQEAVETYMQNEIKKAPLLDAPGPGYPRNSIFIKEKSFFQAIPADQSFRLVSPMSLINTNEEKQQTAKDHPFSSPVELRLSK